MPSDAEHLRDMLVPPRQPDTPDPQLTLRAERVRVAFRQFQTYAALFRQYAKRGSDVDTMRKYATAAADCLDAATFELLGVINPDMMREEIEALMRTTHPEE